MKHYLVNMDWTIFFKKLDECINEGWVYERAIKYVNERKQKMDDYNLCYLRYEHEINRDNCLSCDGYNATCDDYTSIGQMFGGMDNGDTLRTGEIVPGELEGKVEIEVIKKPGWMTPKKWGFFVAKYTKNYINEKLKTKI